jgi:LmbE family N-acetylglucosaminyl deacetylase
MKLRLGSPRSALIVAPHADDEVIGAYGLMRQLRTRGARVRVLIVTDGAASHRHSAAWPPERLVTQRIRESRWALRRLGICASDIHTLDLPDAGLETPAAEAGNRIRRFVARCADLDLLVGPLSQDDHADHRVVADALAKLHTRARRLGYPVWPQPRAHESRSLVVPGGALAKAFALRTYRSQTGMITDDPQGFALSRQQARMFCAPLERFVELPGGSYRHTTPRPGRGGQCQGAFVRRSLAVSG